MGLGLASRIWANLSFERWLQRLRCLVTSGVLGLGMLQTVQGAGSSLGQWNFWLWRFRSLRSY